MKTIIYSFSFPHHGKYSSFHHLVDYLRDQTIVDHSINLPKQIPARLNRRFIKYWHEYGEFRLLRHYVSKKPKIFHYLRPENNLRFAWKWKRNHKLILSCHQPIKKLEEMKSEGVKYDGFFRGLACADIIVVLSQTQINGYKQFAPHADIQYIPLGIDTEFFSSLPLKSTPKPIILTIGSWLRDYVCWAEVVKILTAKVPNIEFIVVANKDAIQRAQNGLPSRYSNVRFLSGVSDEQLRALYQQAAVFFLPLEDAVGNNALLESMAIGVPSVVTGLPSTEEYLANIGGFLIKDAAPEAYADRLMELLNNQSLWNEKSQEAIDRAKNNFSWLRIAEQYRTIYNSL